MMQSGFLCNRGEAYSSFQQWKNALPSLQDIKVPPEPVLHRDNEKQNNRIAAQYLGELRVGCSPAQLNQGNGKSQQNVQRLHHQQESQASVLSTGFRHPIPEDSAYISQSSHNQINRECNAHLYSSAQVSAQHSSYFRTSANASSVRQSINNHGQQKKCSKRNFRRHFLKRSNLKNNNGLHQRHLNCASLACTSSAALQGVTSQMFPLQDQCSSVTVCKKQTSSPLLVALLKGNPTDTKSFTTLSFLSEETNGNIELNTTHFSDESHPKGQQVKGPQAALNCRQTRTQNLDHSGVTSTTPHQKHVSSPSLSSQPSTDKVLPVGQMEPPTDTEIYDFIEQTLTYFRTVLTQKNRHGHHEWDRDLTLQSDCTMPNSVALLPTTSASDKDVERQSLNCAVIEECTAAIGQALKEDSSKDNKANAELTPKFKETDCCATSVSMKPSTGAVVSSVDNSKQPKSEFVERSPSVDLDLPVEKDLDVTMPGSGYYKRVSSDDGGKSFELASLIENQGANTKKRKNSERCSVTFKEAIARAELDSPVDKIQIHNIVSIPANQSEKLFDQTSGEGTRKDAGSMCSQIQLSTALKENKVKEHTPQSEIEGEEAHPQYEDISDDDVSQLAPNLPNAEHEELSIPASIKYPQYEDISDADSPQNENMTVKKSQIPGPKAKDEQSPFENECYGHVQGQAQMKTEIISDEEVIPKQQVSLKTETVEIARQCSLSCFVETNYGFEELSCPKCNHKTQTNNSVSNSPCSVLKADDEMDYDCLVISMLDLKLEPEDEDQHSPGKNVPEGWETGDQERQCDISPKHLKSVLAFDFPQLPVYDTKESFIQAVKCRFEVASGKSTPEHEMSSEEAQDRKQSVDICETEDSCDYSSASEYNCLTVLRKKSALRPSKTDVSVSEKEGEGDEVANTQKGQTRSMDKFDCMQKLRRLIEAKAGCSKHVQPMTNVQQISKKDDVIVIVSFKEDDSVHYCKKKAKRKRKEKKCLFYSDLEDSGDAPCRHQKRLHGTVDQQFGTIKEKFPNLQRLPSADSLATLHRYNHETPTEEMLQVACSNLSHSTGKSGQLTKSKDASDHVEGVIIVESDTEDDNIQKYKKPSRTRFFSSQSDSGDALYAEPETRPSSVDSSLSQCQSKLHDTQVKRMMPDACSDLSHNRKKSGKLIEAKGSSVHVQQKANRQTKSRRAVSHNSVIKKGYVRKKKADKKGISLRSGDSSDDLFATRSRTSRLCGTVDEKPQKNRLSSEDLPEHQLKSVNREADSTLGPNPVIRRLFVKPSLPNTSLILLEEPRVHRQGKERTLSPQTFMASSKKTDSCEKSKASMCRNKPAKDKHSTMNNIQANIPTSRMFSRRLSLHRHDCPASPFSSLSSEQLSEARLSSASRGFFPSGETTACSSLPTSKQTTFIPRQYFPSSKLQSHSYGSPSTSSSATMPLSAKEQLNKDWKRSFYPTRMDKKNVMKMEKDFRATNDLSREAGLGPYHHDKAPRQRCKSGTSKLKKTKIVAIQRTKDINRDAPKERCPVGEGYKWSMKATKESRREGKKCRSLPIPQW